MKKVLKISGFVLILILAFLIIFPIFFKDKVISVIQNEANKQLNAVLHFDDAGLSLFRDFPNLSLKIDNLTLSGKGVFEQDTLVEFKTFTASLNLKSVISGDQIQVNKLVLDHAKIQAIVFEDGTSNLDIMLPDTTASDDLSDTVAAEPLVLQLKQLKIINSYLSYYDEELAVRAVLNGFDFEMSGDLSEELSNLDISTHVKELSVTYENIAYLSNVDTEFSGIVEANLTDDIYTFKENVLSMNRVLMEFEGYVSMPDTNIYTDIKFSAPDTDFRNALSLVPLIYKSDFEGLEATGSFNLNGFVKGTYNSISMPAYGVDLNVENGRINYPDLPKSIDKIFVDMNVTAHEGSGDDIDVNIKKANLETAGNPFAATIFAGMTAQDTYTKGEISGTLDFNTLKEVLPIDDLSISGILKTNFSFDGKLSDIEKEQYQNFRAEGYFNLKGFELKGEEYPHIIISEADMNLSPQYLALNRFSAKSGKSDFNLTGRIDNILNYVFSDDVLRGSFTFSSSLIDVDELAGLAESDSDDSETDSSLPETEASSEEVIRIPENIHFSLNSDIKKIIYDGLVLDNARGKIVINAGAVNMENLNFNTLGGSIGMTGTYDSKPNQPYADFRMRLTGINIKELYNQFVTVQKIAPVAEHCTGSISAGMSFNSSLGDDMMPIYSTLNSAGNLHSNEIGLQNNSLFNALGERTNIEAFKNPALKNIRLQYEIKNGNLEVKPTDFSVRDSKMQIAGTHNLDKSIDFDLNIDIPSRFADGLYSRLPSQTLPPVIKTKVKIGGTSDEPKITGLENNLADGLRDVVRDRVDDVKEDLKEEAQKIINDAQAKADAIMREAERQADNIRKTAKAAGDRLIAEAEKQGQELINKANNPIAKRAAEESAKKLTETARNQAKKLNEEADEQAKGVLNKAQKEADEIMETARRRAENL